MEEKLRTLRQEKELSQADLAEIMEVSRRVAVWLAALLCLLALAAGICIGYIAAPKPESDEIILMEDMKGEEVEEEARNTFATESLEEGK